MSCSQRPAKRQRTDGEITRSSLWHQDGSVVLQAASTQFRVHWSVLSLHSGFFKEMQTLPQPPGSVLVENCHVVELHDTPNDVQHLLEALYDPTLFGQPMLPFASIAGIIRLSRKYDFQNLLQTAARRLSHEHPTAFSVFPRDYRPTMYTFDGQKTLLEVLKLAREAQLWTILPVAYLRVIIDLLHTPTKSQSLSISQPDASTIELDAVDQRNCIQGAHRIMEALWNCNDFWQWFSSADAVSARCVNPTRCGHLKTKMFRALVVKRAFVHPNLSFTKQLCSECEAHQALIIRESWEAIWPELPVLLGLPRWDELRDEL
ncbi:BTB domain-containing protein [Mycena kentingensis (nom. inval.)]|nr:BTB domain-containing protein [Mycena kentingensis (nom. inval.)]